MLTGRQLRDARILLRLTRSDLAIIVGIVRPGTVRRAEMDGSIEECHLTAIEEKLRALGVEFGPDGVRLRADAGWTSKVRP